MLFDKPIYIFPPRTSVELPAENLQIWENKKWWAQVKKNGTNHLVYVSPDKKLTSYGRHENLLIDWNWSGQRGDRFRALPGKGWYVINTEAMYKKHLSRGVNYIFDILVCDGEYLLGQTYAQRYHLLQTLFLHDSIDQTKSHYVLDEHTWFARNIRSDFEKTFNSLTEWEDEGLVLKNPKGILTTSKSAVAWSVKCRKPTENVGLSGNLKG